MGIVNNTLTHKHVNVMMFNDHHHLSQAEIESLTDEDYSMFLAYGDTLTDHETVQTGARCDQLWEDEATRLIAEAEGEELLQRKRLRVCFYNSYAPISY
tara:strand:+ start:5103 stop:5399 length:297 start_codon:yes stop_codon:yes gene_type:complete